MIEEGRRRRKRKIAGGKKEERNKSSYGLHAVEKDAGGQREANALQRESK